MGSAATAVVAALHERLGTRVLVVVTPSPTHAAETEADLEILLGRNTSYLFPQREALPYESSEPHLEIGGLRVEAVEALLGGGHGSWSLPCGPSRSGRPSLPSGRAEDHAHSR